MNYTERKHLESSLVHGDLQTLRDLARRLPKWDGVCPHCQTTFGHLPDCWYRRMVRRLRARLRKLEAKEKTGTTPN